jgi:hypothetical protein
MMFMWKKGFVKVGLSAGLALGLTVGLAAVGSTASEASALAAGDFAASAVGGAGVNAPEAAIGGTTPEVGAGMTHGPADGAIAEAGELAKEKRCPDQALWERRIELLESALAPASADEAVNDWAEAVKNRNGAVQYSLLSPELKKRTLEAYRGMSWVTGVSSPWVDSYQISEGVPSDDGSVVYDVTFALKTSSGDAGTGTVKVTVGQQDGNWPITGLEYVDDAADVLNGITIVP